MSGRLAAIAGKIIEETDARKKRRHGIRLTMQSDPATLQEKVTRSMGGRKPNEAEERRRKRFAIDIAEEFKSLLRRVSMNPNELESNFASSSRSVWILTEKAIKSVEEFHSVREQELFNDYRKIKEHHQSNQLAFAKETLAMREKIRRMGAKQTKDVDFFEDGPTVMYVDVFKTLDEPLQELVTCIVTEKLALYSNMQPSEMASLQRQDEAGLELKLRETEIRSEIAHTRVIGLEEDNSQLNTMVGSLKHKLQESLALKSKKANDSDSSSGSSSDESASSPRSKRRLSLLVDELTTRLATTEQELRNVLATVDASEEMPRKAGSTCENCAHLQIEVEKLRESQQLAELESCRLNEALSNEARLNEGKLNEGKLNEATLNEATLNEAKYEAKLNEAMLEKAKLEAALRDMALKEQVPSGIVYLSTLQDASMQTGEQPLEISDDSHALSSYKEKLKESEQERMALQVALVELRERLREVEDALRERFAESHQDVVDVFEKSGLSAALDSKTSSVSVWIRLYRDAMDRVERYTTRTLQEAKSAEEIFRRVQEGVTIVNMSDLLREVPTRWEKGISIVPLPRQPLYKTNQKELSTDERRGRRAREKARRYSTLPSHSWPKIDTSLQLAVPLPSRPSNSFVPSRSTPSFNHNKLPGTLPPARPRNADPKQTPVPMGKRTFRLVPIVEEI